MSSRWPFPPDAPGDGTAQDLFTGFTVVDVPAGLVDGPVPGDRSTRAATGCGQVR
jgi:hypothetical protein